MLPQEDVERLSRWLAGDLSETERAALEADVRHQPELASALVRMQALDRGLVALPVEAPPTARDREMIRRLTASRARSWGPWLLAAAAVLAAFVLWTRRESEPPHVVQDKVAPAETAAPPVVWGEMGEMHLRPGETAHLQPGTALARGSLGVEMGSAHVEVNGLAIVSTEPKDAFAHATQALNSSHLGDEDMNAKLKSTLSQPSFATAAVLVAVLQGHATARAETCAQADVSAGETWSCPTAPSHDRPLDPGIGFKDVAKAVHQAAGSLTRCYEQGLAQNPKLSGIFKVKMRIVPGAEHGVLSDAEVDPDYSLQNPFVASCVLAELGRVPYPQPRGAEARIVWPFEFHPRGEKSPGAEMVFPDGAFDERRTYLPNRTERLDVHFEHSPSFGPAGAPVTVVELSELGCSFCAKGHDLMLSLMREYPERVRFVFVQYPLHAAAGEGSRAALAAADQGKFLPFIGALYRQEGLPDRATLERVAMNLGLDMPRFRGAMEGSQFASLIQETVREANRLGVRGSPAFFINGREVVGAQPIEVYRQMIDEELKRP